MVILFCEADVNILLEKKRRSRGSNPSDPCESRGFRDQPVRPLRHSALNSVTND